MWLPDIALILGAAFFGGLGILYILDWIAEHYRQHIRDIGYARNYAKIALANAIKGMSSGELDYMRMHGSEIHMITSGEEPLYIIRCSGSRDLDRDYMADFLRVSHQYNWPYLFPIREAKNDGILSQWENAEENAAIATRKLVNDDEVAEPATGNRPARIKDGLTYLDICRKYGISV